MIKISIEYEFGIELDYNSEEMFNSEFNKLRKIIKEDTEKFLLSNIDNPNSKKKIRFELEE